MLFESAGVMHPNVLAVSADSTDSETELGSQSSTKVWCNNLSDVFGNSFAQAIAETVLLSAARRCCEWVNRAI